MATTFFHRTMDRTTDSGYCKKWIFSAWIKRADLSGNQGLFSIQKGSTSNSRVNVGSGSSNTLWVETKDSTGNDDAFKETKSTLQDVNGWYHIYIKYDSTESTASDRLRIIINGSEPTYQNVNDVSSNFGILMDSSVDWRLGIYRTNGGDIRYFNGVMSHVHFSEFNDSDTPTPYTAFGSTDATTGEWKINTSPTVSYGSQGLFVLKDNNLGTDQSGQSNNLTASGNCTKTEDCPSNVFATMNSLLNTNSNLSFTNGNTKIATSSQWLGTCSTLPMFQGKFYWEFKGDPNFMIGVSQLNSDATEIVELSTANTGYSSRFATGYEIINGGNKSNNNNSSTSYGSSYSSSDIGMVAFDATNGVLWFGKNGAWQNSATQTQIENGTTTYAAYTGLTNSNGYVASCSVENGHVEFNFGNGYFGTTAISSEGTNASGIGKFEYDVPSGYTALSTKGLNE